MLHAKAACSLKIKAGWGGELILIPGWGAAAKHLGQGLLAQSYPSFAPSGRQDAASLPGSLRVQSMEMLQVWLRCPFFLLLKGSLMDLHLFGCIPCPTACVEEQPVHPAWDKGSRCPLHSLLPCDLLPHFFWQAGGGWC